MPKPLSATLKSKGKGRLRAGFNLGGQSDSDDEDKEGMEKDLTKRARLGMGMGMTMNRPLVNLDTPDLPMHISSASNHQLALDHNVDPLDAFMMDLHQTSTELHGHGLGVNSVHGNANSNSNSSINAHGSKNSVSVHSTGKTSGNGKSKPNKGPSLAANAGLRGNIDPFGSNFITAEAFNKKGKVKYGWESDTTAAGISGVSDMESETEAEAEEEDEEEEVKRAAFMKALKAHSSSSNSNSSSSSSSNKIVDIVPETEIGSDLGVLYGDDGDVQDEDMHMTQGGKSALELLEAHKKGKELKPVHHEQVEYISFRKNLYLVPRSIAQLSIEEVQEIRDELDVRVRGRGCPSPVSSWEQCGLSDRILKVIENANLQAPFPVQQQAIPAIMAGRDVIAVAKTGSGKTLAFLLPMFRHVLDQPPLSGFDGPIGLIMAPARELANQIHNEAKRFTKALGLRIACIYGGAGVAEQIAELKRQPHIVVCTPGRMIDVLCMHAGRLLSLQRITMVIMDEADRMFDMGFEPQIKMIMQNIRPDRQTVLFSATFPKVIEKLAKNVLILPLEIQVGERSSVNKDITQVIEVHEEPDKFLRLLQLLGIYFEKGNVLVFVDKQEKCDQLFAELLRSGYPCLSLHGGIDQVDRDHTLKEFKTLVKTVMVATGVAGRGLDVPEIVCVINYSCPNHLEDYVHRVGRTGRAGRKGIAYTFISKAEEAYSPIMCKVLQLVGTGGKGDDGIPPELVNMRDNFQEKVRAGSAKRTSSGFVGKGFTFGAEEMNESQKLASQSRKAYEIAEGISDKDKGDKEAMLTLDSRESGDDDEGGDGKETDDAVGDIHLTMTKPGSVGSLVQMSKLGPYAQLLLNVLSVIRSKSAHVLRDTTLPNTNIRLFISAPVLKEDGSIDIKVASIRAKHIATIINEDRKKKEGVQALALHQKADSYYQEILDINDYPPQARAKVTQAGKGLDRVQDSMGVNVVSKGKYRQPGQVADANNPGLHLIIEGSSSMQVKKARAEIVRMLDQEVMQLGMNMASSGSGQAMQGRYSVT